MSLENLIVMGLKVLIVDDDPIFVMMHKLKIKASNMAANPQTFFDGKAALEAIVKDNPDDDSYLILLDINMPIMNGWELLNAIQTEPIAKKIFVVMVTSSVDGRDRERAENYPQVIGFYEKALNGSSCLEIKNNPAIAHFYA